MVLNFVYLYNDVSLFVKNFLCLVCMFFVVVMKYVYIRVCLFFMLGFRFSIVFFRELSLLFGYMYGYLFFMCFMYNL